MESNWIATCLESLKQGLLATADIEQSSAHQRILQGNADALFSAGKAAGLRNAAAVVNERKVSINYSIKLIGWISVKTSIAEGGRFVPKETGMEPDLNYWRPVYTLGYSD